MTRVLKSSERDVDAYPAYEHELLEALAGAGLDDGAMDPAAVLAEARAEAERRIQEAYAEGLRLGTEAGKAKFAESVGESAEALKAAAEAIREAHERFIESLEPQVMELVRALTARILHREARTEPELVLSTLRSALSTLAKPGALTARLNPSDLATLRDHKAALLDEFDGVERLDVVSDNGVARGGCIVETDSVRVDARLDAQLNQILDALME